MARSITFVGRREGAESTTITPDPDHPEVTRTVVRGETVAVHPRVAAALLRNPGAASDESADWVPARQP